MTTLAGLVDAEALARFLDAQRPGPPRPLTLERHVAGYSNVTVFVTRGHDRWVLRRPPGGELLPTSHDMLREYRYISALHGRARVPPPILACDDAAVIGAPFYLMERVDGDVLRDSLPPAYDTPAARRRLGEELIDALVEIHAVDWKAVGLRGRESGYLERQAGLWGDQWTRTRPRTRDLPGLDAIGDWLAGHIPASAPVRVVHGDYRLENAIFTSGPEGPHLAAILDWEMATVGDPLADLAWLLNYWADPGEQIEDPRPFAMDAQRLLTAREGFPSRDELAQRYAERSGRPVGDLSFHLVLAAYKLAIILEGLYAGHIEGTGSNPDAYEFEWGVPRMVARGLALIDAMEGGRA